MMEAEAAAAREGSVACVACKGAAPAQEEGSALVASPSAAFDKAELLELLLGHVSTSLTPGSDSHSHSHSPPPSPSPPPPESPEQPCGRADPPGPSLVGDGAVEGLFRLRWTRRG